MKKKQLYISVMGTMGSGKTTAARLLARSLRYRLLEENFGENAFLPRFYEDSRRWAFHSQSFFLMEKLTQLLETRSLLSKYSVVQDTPIEQDVFSYAKAQHVLGAMDDAEWKLYQKIYRSFEPYIPKPDLIVYLDTSVSEIARRIESRGRGYERGVPASYLELLDMLNLRWLAQNPAVAVLRVPTDGLNIVKSRRAQQQFLALVRTRLKKHT